MTPGFSPQLCSVSTCCLGSTSTAWFQLSFQTYLFSGLCSLELGILISTLTKAPQTHDDTTVLQIRKHEPPRIPLPYSNHFKSNMKNWLFFFFPSIFWIYHNLSSCPHCCWPRLVSGSILPGLLQSWLQDWTSSWVPILSSSNLTIHTHPHPSHRIQDEALSVCHIQECHLSLASVSASSPFFPQILEAVVQIWCAQLLFQAWDRCLLSLVCQASFKSYSPTQSLSWEALVCSTGKWHIAPNVPKVTPAYSHYSDELLVFLPSPLPYKFLIFSSQNRQGQAPYLMFKRISWSVNISWVN